MMTTPILEIPEIVGGQTNQYVTANEGLRAMTEATQNFIQLDFAADDIELDDEVFLRHFLFVSIGNTVARVLTVPEKIRFFAVLNLGSEELTITRGTTELALAATASAFYYTDGTEDGLYRIG